jgi:hypothetical protein
MVGITGSAQRSLKSSLHGRRSLKSGKPGILDRLPCRLPEKGYLIYLFDFQYINTRKLKW